MILARPLENWRLVPAAAIAAAAMLLIGGMFAAIYSEQLYKNQKLEDLNVQAHILAEAITPALAFDDPERVDQFVQALRANSAVEAVAVYGADGRFVAGFALPDTESYPSTAVDVDDAAEGNRIATTESVLEGGEALGTVYLRIVTLPLASQIVRWGVMALFAFMAALVIVVLGVAHAALRNASAQLEERKRALDASNEQILVQIRERNLAEEALRQSQKMEAIGQLTGGIAHDFNNLLAAVTSGLRLLDHFDDPKRRRDVMDAMRQAVDRGARLTGQLLSFSRRKALNPQVVAPGSLIRGMRELLQRTLREDIRVDMRLPDDLWSIEADPSQLELAVINLAVNARDAMPQGGVIVIEGENRPGLGGLGDTVRVIVRDTGAGMSAETARRAFEPFFTTKEVGKGTGLGLSQVYGFATQTGGSVDLDTEIGRGTVVSISLPRASRDAAPTQGTVRDFSRNHAQSDMTVLMVEDDDAVASLVQPLVEQLGYKCARVSSAREALDRLERESFDIIFSDIMMPGEMSGLQLARVVRERNPKLPILLTTGYSPAVETAAAEFPLLKKPYQADELARMLAIGLRR